MKSNDSGVAKWSVRRSDRNLASGRAATSRSVGSTKSFSPTATSTGQVTPASSASVNGSGDVRRMIAARAAASLLGCDAY